MSVQKSLFFLKKKEKSTIEFLRYRYSSGVFSVNLSLPDVWNVCQDCDTCTIQPVNQSQTIVFWQ